MGVTGLLPALKQIQEATTLCRYKGQTLAIDTYAWLHRSTMSCSMELAQEVPTNKYINYVMRRIEMLHHFGITPYMVFDGDYLPCKNNTETDRETRRNEYKKQGLAALQRGDSKLAYSCFQKSCDITPSMAKALIEVFRSKAIKYVVAPYEADSQMVYLEKIGLVDGIISEDSDLLIFGCKKLITKLNDKGECVEINRANFKKCKQVPIHYLSQEQLRIVATLSGCDYTKGIMGIGVIKAFNLVKRYGTLDKIITALKLENKYKIPDSFLEEFELANHAFQYQLVFDPTRHEPTHLSEVPEGAAPMLVQYSGARLDDHIHRSIARGDLHPIEKTPLISREVELMAKRGIAVRSTSLSYAHPSATPPSKMAARAYSTPAPSVSNNKTIDNFFAASTEKSTTSKKRSVPQVASSSVSVKRTRVLLGGDKISLNSTATVSKFFTPKREQETLEKDSQDLSEIDKDSQPKTSACNFEAGAQLHQDLSLNTSDFEIEDLSEDDNAERQVLLTQTEEGTQNGTSQHSHTVAVSNEKENIKLSKHIVPSSDNESVSDVESPIHKRQAENFKEARQGLRAKFGLPTSAHRAPLRDITAQDSNRRQDITSRYEYKSRKAEIKPTVKPARARPTSSIIGQNGQLNLENFIYRGD